MIDSRELKLNNWILDPDGNPLQLTAEELAFILTNEFQQLGCDPIAISPDILEKCGFVAPVLRGEDSDYSKDFDLDGVDFNGIDTIYSLNGWYLGLYNGKWHHAYENAGYDEEAHLYTVGIGCECLHQLQNLYYALTGKELTITL